MSGGGFHSPDPGGSFEALKEYSQAMFSGDNIDNKLGGEIPEYAAELAESWAEMAPENKRFLCSLDPEFKTIDFKYTAFPEFPGANEAAYQVCRSTYIDDIEYEIKNSTTGEVKYKYKSTKDLPKEEKQGGEAVHACILNGIQARDIRVDYETRAYKLVLNEQGEVIGVRARKGKDRIFYRSRRGVVLTTGGYGFNRELRSAFLEGSIDSWAFYSSFASTGDGIIMAMEAGAALSKAASVSARICAAVPVRRNGLRIGLSVEAFGKPNEIVVDNYGNRYANERNMTRDPSRYFFYKKALVFDTERLVYPRIPSWLIFDENLRMKKAIVKTPVTRYHSISWSEDNMKAINKGWILKSSTIEELGSKIKEHRDNRNLMNPGKLKKTVEVFNDYCLKGKDDDYNREEDSLEPIERPPFYALPLYLGGPNTKGGIAANGRRQVLNWEKRPVPRLYSAGEVSSAFKFMYHAGGNIAECIAFGRIAGKNAAMEPELKFNN